MEKIFNQKNFINFVWSPLSSRGNIFIKFLPSSSLSGVCSLILFPLFATGVNDTGGKFAAGVVDTGGNLPPASLTQKKQFATGVIYTGGKFATGVVDTGGAP
jgi:hypothetical protein